MDEVVSHVNALFSNDADAQRRANDFLIRLPEQGNIWAIVPHLLQHSQFQVQFIGTKLIYNSLRFHFDIANAKEITVALTAFAHEEHLPAAVRLKLCASLATLLANQSFTLREALQLKPEVALGVLEYFPDELLYRHPMVQQVEISDYVSDICALMRFLRKGVDPVVPQCLTVLVNWARVMDLRFLNDSEIACALIRQMPDPQVVDCMTEGLMRSPQVHNLWSGAESSGKVDGPEGDCLQALITYLRINAFDSIEWVQALSMVAECYLQVASVHQHILYAVGALFQHNSKLSMMLTKFFHQLAEMRQENIIGVDECRFILPIVTEPCIRGMTHALSLQQDHDEAMDYQQCARTIAFKLLMLWIPIDHGEFFMSLLDPTTVGGLILLEDCMDAFDGEVLPSFVLMKFSAMLNLSTEAVPYMGALIASCARYFESVPDIIPVASQFLCNNLHHVACASAFKELAGSCGHLLPIGCVDPLVAHLDVARLPPASDANCFAGVMCIVRSRPSEESMQRILDRCYNFERALTGKSADIRIVMSTLFQRIDMCLSVVDSVDDHEQPARKRTVANAIFAVCSRNFDRFSEGCVFALCQNSEITNVAAKALRKTIRYLKDASPQVQAEAGTRILRMTQQLPLKWALMVTKECVVAEHAPQDISSILDTAFGSPLNEETLTALFALIQVRTGFAKSRWTAQATELGFRVLSEQDDPDLIKSVLGFLLKSIRSAYKTLSEQDRSNLHSLATLTVLHNFHKWDNRCDKELIFLLETLSSHSITPFATFLQCDGPLQSQLQPDRKEVCLRCFNDLRDFKLTVFIRDLRYITRKERPVDVLIASEMNVRLDR